MTENHTRLTYAREFLLKFEKISKPDPSIQSIFKDVLSPAKNELTRTLPSTVDRYRNLKADKKPAPVATSLTPDAHGNNPKWRSKTALSPRDATKNTGQKSSLKKPQPVIKESPNSTNNNLKWRNGPKTSPSQKENSVSSSNGSAVLVHATKAGNPAEISKTVGTHQLINVQSPSPLTSPGFSQFQTPFSPSSPSSSSPSPTPSPSLFSPSSVPFSPSRSVQSHSKTQESPHLLSPPKMPLSPKSPKSGSPKIIDEHQLQQRQKQIDYGHQTLGYVRYRLLVPKEKRSRDDPRTPKKTQACSKRSWDGQIRKWRRDLHKWDPEDPVAFMAWLESDFVVQIINNNMGSELLEILEKIKERAAKFQNSPDSLNYPEDSPNFTSPLARDDNIDTSDEETPETRSSEMDQQIVRKLVF